MNPIFDKSRILCRTAKKELESLLIDISKISNNEDYERAVDFNRIVMRSIRTISTMVDSIGEDVQNLRLDKIENSALHSAVMQIDKQGRLILEEGFLMDTGLASGRFILPHHNKHDPNFKKIYFLEDPYKQGYMLKNASVNISRTLQSTHKTYPTRVLWEPLNYQGNKGFSLIFNS